MNTKNVKRLTPEAIAYSNERIALIAKARELLSDESLEFDTTLNDELRELIAKHSAPKENI